MINQLKENSPPGPDEVISVLLEKTKMAIAN